MVHVLLVIPVIGTPVLVTVGWIVGAVGVDQKMGRTIGVLTVGEVDAEERLRQAIARLEVHGILEAGEGGLAGEIRISGEATAD
jgi:hypothetical protein